MATWENCGTELGEVCGGCKKCGTCTCDETEETSGESSEEE